MVRSTRAEFLSIVGGRGSAAQAQIVVKIFVQSILKFIGKSPCTSECVQRWLFHRVCSDSSRKMNPMLERCLNVRLDVRLDRIRNFRAYPLAPFTPAFPFLYPYIFADVNFPYFFPASSHHDFHIPAFQIRVGSRPVQSDFPTASQPRFPVSCTLAVTFTLIKIIISSPYKPGSIHLAHNQ